MKITTVVPAYKPKYLFELLAAMAQQTEPPEQIIFSDDSPDQSFTRTLESEPVKSLVAHLNISVIPGPRRGAHANWAHCIKAWGESTELLHILCDDDIVYPKFYEMHRRAHEAGVFSSTVSRRWYANETGQPVRHGLSVPDIVADHPQKMVSLDANLLFTLTVGQAGNWLGEVSNTVMRAEVADLIVARECDGISFAGLEDLGSFVCGAMSKPLCFINDHLGFFRQSAEQNSAKTMSAPMKCSIIAYIGLALIGRHLGRIAPAHQQYCIEVISQNVLWHYRDDADVAEIRDALPDLVAGVPGGEGRFLQAWSTFVTAHGNF